MPANAPHGTTSEYSTCSAEAISRITIVKAFTSNHVVISFRLGKSFNEFVAILVIGLGESFYHVVATIEPYGISSKVVAIIIVLVCWK